MDIPCFELAKQTLKDMGFPKEQQKWPTRKLIKWIRITWWTIIIFTFISLILSIVIGFFMGGYKYFSLVAWTAYYKMPAALIAG